MAEKKPRKGSIDEEIEGILDEVDDQKQKEDKEKELADERAPKKCKRCRAIIPSANMQYCGPCFNLVRDTER